MRAVFLDRDGVLNRNAPPGDYIRTVGELEILPGVPEAVRLLNELGFRVIVVTNQRGVSRGMMSLEDVEAVNAAIDERLAHSGARIDAIYYCPHEEGSCGCRKPGTGMFLRAVEDFPDVVLADSVVIGDSWRDMEAAHSLNCAGILVAETVDARECAMKHGIDVAGSLPDAVERYVAGLTQ